MKSCSYCGRENTHEELCCRECGTEFERPSEATVPEESKAADILLSGKLSGTAGVLKAIASLEVDLAVELLSHLQKAGIAAEAQAGTQEGGLDYRDILVEDSNYDRACDVAEAWEAERRADAERRSNNVCASCGSRNVEYINTETFGSIWKCKNCGNNFVN